MKSVVFASFAKFPRGDSNAIHFVNMGSIFCDLGYEVSYIGFGDKNCSDSFGKYYSLRKSSGNSFFSKVVNHLNMGGRLCGFLKKYFLSADVIILSGCLKNSQLKSLKKFFAKNSQKTKFVISMTEEYTKDEFSNFNYFVKRGYKINKFLNTKFNDTSFKIISISTYLNNKFTKRGFDSMFLPFVFADDFAEYLQSKEHENINYLYCGSPDNKDKVVDILQAFSNLEGNYKEKIHLNLVGISENILKRKKPEILEKLRDFTSFFGRKDYDFVKKMYAETDYSILLRDGGKTFAKAGCPTKIVESLFYGVCPITNLTGDLDKYLVDRKNSIIVKECSSSAFKESIVQSINDFNKINKLKSNARETYDNYFKASNYKDRVKEFLQL